MLHTTRAYSVPQAHTSRMPALFIYLFIYCVDVNKCNVSLAEHKTFQTKNPSVRCLLIIIIYY